MQRDNKYKWLEDSILKEMDLLIERAKSQGEKSVYNLFKSLVLKKYKNEFDKELTQGEVHRDNVYKAVDFCYSDICVCIRKQSTFSDDDKESLIREGKEMLPTIKSTVIRLLANNGIKVID